MSAGVTGQERGQDLRGHAGTPTLLGPRPAQSAPGAPRSARRAHRDEDRASGEMLTAEDVRQKHSEAYKLGTFELLRRTN